MLNPKDFCDADEIRSYLTKPSKLNGKAIGCNGHVLLVSPLVDDDLPEWGGKIEFMTALIEKAETADYALLDSVVEPPEQIACPDCDGTGKSEREACYECDGSGDVVLENDYNDYECECQTCSGRGNIKRTGGNVTCTECAGSGKRYANYASVEVMGVRIMANYYSMVKDEPDIMFAVSKDDEYGKLFFKAGEQFGVIIGMVK